MAEETQVLSQWHRHIEGAQHPVDQFYRDIQAAVERRLIPDVRFARVEYKEGGMFSAKREYLRISRDDLYYEICGAPFANGFFIASRLFSARKLADSMVESSGRSGLAGEIFAGVTAKVLGTHTWYRVDTALMFGQLVHSALMEVVDALVEQQILPRIVDLDRKPVMRAFF